MWMDLLFFAPMAILSNTSLPIAFDPVLIAYVATHSTRAACAFAVAGSICAGLAGIADAKFLGLVRGRVSDRWLKWLPSWQGRGFYLFTFLFALMPLPFTVVRLAVVRYRPHALLYSLVIFLGRLPRYLLVVFLFSVTRSQL